MVQEWLRLENRATGAAVASDGDLEKRAAERDDSYRRPRAVGELSALRLSQNCPFSVLERAESVVVLKPQTAPETTDQSVFATPSVPLGTLFPVSRSRTL